LYHTLKCFISSLINKKCSNLRVSSTSLPTGRSLMVIWRRIPFPSITKSPRKLTPSSSYDIYKVKQKRKMSYSLIQDGFKLNWECIETFNKNIYNFLRRHFWSIASKKNHDQLWCYTQDNQSLQHNWSIITLRTP